jgi:hypothetical protein
VADPINDTHTRQPRRRADDAEIIDLIANVRSVRINLSADLSAAAGAVDEGQLEIARDILEADRAELASLTAAARRSLREPVPTTELPRPRRSGRSRTRMLLAIPAVPLVGALAMTAAAALGAGPHSHHSSIAATTRPAVVRSATGLLTPSTRPTAVADSTLQRLENVVTHHPRAAQVLALADDLHEQLTHMIATSKDNPQQLGVVRQLLNLEQQMLEGNSAPGSTVALAASRQISQLLSQVPTTLSTVTAPSNAPTNNPPSWTTPTSTTPPDGRPTTTTKTPTSTTTTTPSPQRHSSPKPSHHPTKKPGKLHNPLFGQRVFRVVL